MATIGINPAKVHHFVLERERALPPAEQTVFQLKRLSGARYFVLTDDPGTAIGRGVSESLVGITGAGLRDEDGLPMPFTTGAEAVKNLDVATLSELWRFITTNVSLEETHRKNSESPQGSSAA